MSDQSQGSTWNLPKAVTTRRILGPLHTIAVDHAHTCAREQPMPYAVGMRRKRMTRDLVRARLVIQAQLDARRVQ